MWDKVTHIKSRQPRHSIPFFQTHLAAALGIPVAVLGMPLGVAAALGKHLGVAAGLGRPLGLAAGLDTPQVEAAVRRSLHRAADQGNPGMGGPAGDGGMDRSTFTNTTITSTIYHYFYRQL